MNEESLTKTYLDEDADEHGFSLKRLLRNCVYDFFGITTWKKNSLGNQGIDLED